jgi:hypothetical protein
LPERYTAYPSGPGSTSTSRLAESGNCFDGRSVNSLSPWQCIRLCSVFRGCRPAEPMRRKRHLDTRYQWSISTKFAKSSSRDTAI